MAEQLKITQEELNRLLIEIIQDGKSELKIDQMNGCLSKPVDEFAGIDDKRYSAFNSFARQLEGLRSSMADKIM